MKQLIIGLITILTIISCKNELSSDHVHHEWTIVKYIQDKPDLVHINLGDTSHDHGDAMAFEAVLRDTNGSAVGDVLGWLITVDIMDGDSVNPSHVVERIGTMVYNFGQENEIMVQGGISYHKGDQQMKIGISQKRAIVGGTGKYKGIEGEVTTTRNNDGTYLHVLDMKIEKE